jgi:hypothetical protein
MNEALAKAAKISSRMSHHFRSKNATDGIFSITATGRCH